MLRVVEVASQEYSAAVLIQGGGIYQMSGLASSNTFT